MPKISVIIPVYNTEKYLEKCLNSILKQIMQDFEIIVVNDGSTDDSAKILRQFELQYPDKIKYFEKQNGGVSDARNFGVKKAIGEYLCFVDSDDYIDENLFENLEKYINQNAEIIKYKCIKVNENYEKIELIDGPVFECKTGYEAFNELYVHDVFLEIAWLYLYKRNFFVKNKFEFPTNKYHEDWALVPYIILNAKSVISTNIYGYYYVQSKNSITRNNNDEKIYKRVCNMLEHFDNLIEKISNIKNKQAIENFKLYMTNCLILKLEELPQKYHKQYIKEIKKRKIINNIKVRNAKQFIKKVLLKINVKLYLKLRH